jgi:UDP-N-acetylglucosamine 4-epimerase
MRVNQIYNIACGQQTSLQQLFEILKTEASSTLNAIHGPDRKGDVKHSLADITKAKELLGYHPDVSVAKGLQLTFQWYKKQSVK